MDIKTELMNDLNIDQNLLDTHCIDIPRIIAKWNLRLSDSIKKRDNIKQERKVYKAELEKEIRSSDTPEVYGLNKITDKSIVCSIDSDLRTRDLEQQLIDAEYEVNVLQAAVESLRDKKSQIKNLVLLYHDEYWSNQPPKISEEVKEKMNKGINDEISSALEEEFN